MADPEAIREMHAQADQRLEVAIRRLGDLAGLPVPDLHPFAGHWQESYSEAMRLDAMADYLTGIAGVLEAPTTAPDGAQAAPMGKDSTEAPRRRQGALGGFWRRWGERG